MNVETGAYEQFLYVNEPHTYYEYGNNIYVISNDDVHKFDKVTLLNSVVFENAWDFGTSILTDDKIYLSGSETANSDIGVVEINLTNDVVTFLPNSETGNTLYSPKLALYENELYFIAKTIDHHLLNKYDFDNNIAITLDTLATLTGATVEHALENVNGNLLISKRPMSIGHELYVWVEDSIIIANNNYTVNKLNVYPTVSSTEVNLLLEDNLINKNTRLTLFDLMGNAILTSPITNTRIDIRKLTAGVYIGIVESDDVVYRFEIIKQ